MWWSIALVVTLFALAGCGGDDEEEDAGRTVVASFYPLAWAAEQVGGDDFDVVNLTPAGAEPHDLELSPQDVEAVRDAELVLYVSAPGFQPAVLDAVAQHRGTSIDAAGYDADPHVWLDPLRFVPIVESIGEALVRPEAANELVAELHALDRDYRRGLEQCERRAIVTTHAAFGHLAERYGLDQVSLAGLSPESEPSPRAVEQLVEEVESSGATTVFAEPLVSSALAETVSREAGVDVTTLDPLEGLSEDALDAGDDYLSVMRDNLAALREALGCR